MLSYSQTFQNKSAQADIVTGASFKEEGVAAVFSREDNGQVKIKPSTGAAGEVFAGFTVERNVPPEFLPQVETHVASTDGTQLFRNPIVGQLGVTGADVEAGPTASEAGKVAIENGKVSYHADDIADGVEFTFTYHFTATIEDARALGGDSWYVNLASAETNRIGYIKGGEIGTTLFDATADWSDPSVMHPSLGANGMLTVGGSGTKLTNLVIKQAPNAGSPFLVVEMK